jgi:hypothetical protein
MEEPFYVVVYKGLSEQVLRIPKANSLYPRVEEVYTDPVTFRVTTIIIEV